MKVTMSRDGKRRFTLRIDHRIDAETFANALAHWAVTEAEERPERLAKSYAEHILRDQFRFNSREEFTYWADDVVEDDQQEIWGWAKAQVARLFPDLD